MALINALFSQNGVESFNFSFAAKGEYCAVDFASSMIACAILS